MKEMSTYTVGGQTREIVDKRDIMVLDTALSPGRE